MRDSVAKSLRQIKAESLALGNPETGGRAPALSSQRCGTSAGHAGSLAETQSQGRAVSSEDCPMTPEVGCTAAGWHI